MAKFYCKGEKPEPDQVLQMETRARFYIMGEITRAKFYSLGTRAKFYSMGEITRTKFYSMGTRAKFYSMGEMTRAKFYSMEKMARARVKFYSVGKELDHGQVLQNGGEGPQPEEIASVDTTVHTWPGFK